MSTAVHSMYFQVSVPTRISTDPGHGTRIVSGHCPILTLTANAESWAVEAFSLCVFTSTKISEWSPMERRAPAQGSSRDQCI